MFFCCFCLIFVCFWCFFACFLFKIAHFWWFLTWNLDFLLQFCSFGALFCHFCLIFACFWCFFSIFLSFFDPKSIKIDTFLSFFCCFPSFFAVLWQKSVFWVIFGSKRAKIDQKWPPGGGVPGGSQNGSRGTQNGPKVPKKCQFWSLFLIFGPPSLLSQRKKITSSQEEKHAFLAFFFQLRE